MGVNLFSFISSFQNIIDFMYNLFIVFTSFAIAKEMNCHEKFTESLNLLKNRVFNLMLFENVQLQVKWSYCDLNLMNFKKVKILITFHCFPYQFFFFKLQKFITFFAINSLYIIICTSHHKTCKTANEILY